MKSYFCMPRLGGGGGSSRSRKSRRLITPMSLLDRFREAVFRLIMLSALSSKATTGDENRTSAGSGPHHHHRSYYSYDSHHSEAVAECIEFIKKSATADENRHSTATTNSSSIDAAPGPEVVIPLPVM